MSDVETTPSGMIKPPIDFLTDAPSRLGRPPLNPNDRRNKYIHLRVTKEELETLRLVAKDEGVSTISDLIRKSFGMCPFHDHFECGHA
jgi:hypothetical protein